MASKAAKASAEFSLNLEDGTSGAAEAAAAALTKLQAQMTSDVKALREMEQAMKRLNSATSVDVKAGQALTKQIKDQKDKISAAQASITNLGGRITSTAAKTKDATGRFAGFAKQTEALPGPLGSLARSLASGGKMLGVVGVGALLTVAALVALAAAAVAAVAALTGFALANADARRSELIHLEGLNQLKFGYAGWINRMRGARDSASFLQSTIDQVSSKVALGRDKVAAYAESLYKAGVRGGNLQAALEGISTVAAVQGEGEAQAFRGWVMGATYAGASVKALAADVQARLGGLARRQLLSLSVQAEKLKSNLGRLFNDLRIEGFLEMLSKVGELFSQSSATGRALKSILNALFAPLSNDLSALAPIAKRFFQGLIIGALTATIAVLTLKKSASKILDLKVLKDLDLGKIALKGGAAAAYLLAGGLGLAAAAMVLLVGPLAIGTAAVYGAILAISDGIASIVRSIASVGWSETGVKIVYGIFDGITGGMNWFSTAVIKLFTDLKSYSMVSLVDWSDLGSAIIDGILSGLASGAAKLWKGFKDLAKGGYDAFATIWEIRSPSRVAKRMSLNITGTAASAVISDRPRMAAAFRSTFRPPPPEAVTYSTGSLNAAPEPAVLPARAAPLAPKASASRTVTVSIGEVNVAAPEGTKDPAVWAKAIKDELASLLEGISIEMGAPAI